MSFETDVLLVRLASQVRNDIAPSIDDEYARTQAHMTAVILERLARQAAFGDGHRAAERADIAELVTGLDRILRSAATEAPGSRSQDAAATSPRQLDSACQPDDDLASGGVSESPPGAVLAAVADLRQRGDISAAAAVVESLYRWGPDRSAAAAALALIRPALRRDIDRRMEVAR